MVARFQNCAARLRHFYPLLSISSQKCKKLLLILEFADNIFSSGRKKILPTQTISFQEDRAIPFAVTFQCDLRQDFGLSCAAV